MVDLSGACWGSQGGTGLDYFYTLDTSVHLFWDHTCDRWSLYRKGMFLARIDGWSTRAPFEEAEKALRQMVAKEM